MEHYDITEKPKTLKQKWDNYWYHNKAVTLIGLVIVLTVVVGLYSCATKEKVDFRIIGSGAQSLDNAVLDGICQAFKPYVSDFNNDGEVIVRASYTTIKETASIPTDFSTGQYQKFTVQVVSGDNMLIIGDINVMKSLMEANVLEKLQDGEQGLLAYCVSLGDNWLFENTKLENTEYSTMNPYLENLYVAIRAYDGTIVQGNKYSEFAYNTAKTILAEVIKNKK